MIFLVKPDVYDDLHREEQYTKYECIVSQGTEFKGTIIDVGCGTGLLYEFILKLYGKINGRYICIDPEPGMLKLVQSKFDSPLIISIEARAEELPIRENSGDVIVSVSTWGVLEKSPRLLSELKNAVKTQGLIVITGHPRTYNTSPVDLDAEFEFKGNCIDDIYMFRKQAYSTHGKSINSS
jgi:Methylase involved in ubiquinone/menaquinone biosynthesis